MFESDEESKLIAWVDSARVAREHYARQCQIPAEAIDIQRAVVAALGLEDPLFLLDRNWTAEALIDTVRGMDFAAFSICEDVFLSDSLLPRDALQRLDEETIRKNGEVWRIHKSDPDPFPFLPHAHLLSSRHKMDLRNGKVYLKKRLVWKLSRKELVEFRGRVKKIPLPPLDV